jgi:ribosomal protein L37AE/L43A
MKKVIIIEVQQPQQCDFCGQIDELRPYGPNGEWVCFDCGMKDEESVRRQFVRQFEE